MMPTTIHAGIHSVTPQFSSIPLISSQNLSSRPPKTSIPRRRPFDLDRIPRTSYRRNQREFFACATAEAAVAESPTDESTPPASQVPSLPPVPEGSKVVVKEAAKPRLVLKFIWMEKNIGLGLDQSIPGHGTIPLSPYYFWPRKDAWEELKITLESKPWISQKTMIILLNQVTDIINLWQQSGGTLS